MIDIKHIKKAFQGKPVLKDVNLTIHDGETMVIVGCSGCGKTVLLRLIIGLFKPDDGKIFVDDENIVSMNRKTLFQMRQKFGMLFQGAALFDSMTVEGNVSLPLREHTDFSETDIRERVRQKLEMVGLSGIEEKKPAELSGGMKKRVGLARALVMDPAYVLFDEPTTGLDPIMADAINDLILETNQKLHITSVVVTHDMKSAFKVGDRIAMLCGGRIVFQGTPKEFQESDKDFVRQFVEGKASLETLDAALA